MTSILLVDDERMITGPLARALTQAGYQVTVADNGRDGLALAREKQPDVVVLDVMMPRKDGYEVCAQLKSDSAFSGIPVILLTAVGSAVNSTSYTHRDGMTTEADEYIAKPVDLDQLAELVAELA